MFSAGGKTKRSALTAKHAGANNAPAAAKQLPKELERIDGNGSTVTDVALIKPKSPFLQRGSSADTNRPRLFIFPQEISLGLLQCFPLPDTHLSPADREPKQAKGNVLIPGGVLLQLEAMQPMADNPALFGGFGADDLNAVILESDINWTDKQMAYVRKLTGLQQLRLTNAEITNRSLPYLNKLKKLSLFEAKNVYIDGQGISRLKRLPVLSELILSKCHTLSGKLARLENSEAVHALSLSDCDLQNSDMNVFATLPNLNVLVIPYNPRINDEGFRAICHLTKLHILDLRETGVTSASVPLLKNLPNLQELKITQEQWSLADKAKAHKILSNCRVTLTAGEKDGDLGLIRKVLE